MAHYLNRFGEENYLLKLFVKNASFEESLVIDLTMS